MEKSLQSSMNIGYKRLPSYSGFEKSSNHDKKIVNNSIDLKNYDLGTFAINFCNNFGTFEENLLQNQHVNTHGTLEHTGDVDLRVNSK